MTATVVGEERRDRVLDLLELKSDAFPEGIRFSLQVVDVVDRQVVLRGASTRRRSPSRRDAMARTSAVRNRSARSRGRNLPTGKCIGSQRRKLRRGQPFLQPRDPVARDRRQEDQRLGNQHEHGRQQQQLRGQPQGAPKSAISRASGCRPLTSSPPHRYRVVRCR